MSEILIPDIESIDIWNYVYSNCKDKTVFQLMLLLENRPVQGVFFEWNNLLACLYKEKLASMLWFSIVEWNIVVHQIQWTKQAWYMVYSNLDVILLYADFIKNIKMLNSCFDIFIEFKKLEWLNLNQEESIIKKYERFAKLVKWKFIKK